jgi:predicted CopG family antitoxin
MKPITTIMISLETRNKLASIGGKDDTFEDIVLRLYEKGKKVKE